MHRTRDATDLRSESTSAAGRLGRSSVLAIAMLVIGLGTALASTPTFGVRATPSATRSPATVSARPDWNELTPQQKETLRPLSQAWPSMSEIQRRKWIEMTKTYPSMPSAEQAKIRTRMTEWVALSPQQRSQARLNFGKAQDLSASERKARWEAYQALSPEERQKLRAEADPKPKGAALAIKPVPPDRLAKVPPPTSRHDHGHVHTDGMKRQPKIAGAVPPGDVHPGSPGSSSH